MQTLLNVPLPCHSEHTMAPQRCDWLVRELEEFAEFNHVSRCLASTTILSIRRVDWTRLDGYSRLLCPDSQV